MSTYSTNAKYQDCCGSEEAKETKETKQQEPKYQNKGRKKKQGMWERKDESYTLLMNSQLIIGGAMDL